MNLEGVLIFWDRGFCRHLRRPVRLMRVNEGLDRYGIVVLVERRAMHNVMHAEIITLVNAWTRCSN